MKNKHIAGGLALVSAGVVMLAANLGMISGLWVLGSLAVGFLGAYILFERHLGFLIPGLILGGLTGFAALESMIAYVSGGFLFFFFAGAFYLVYVLHTRHIKSGDRGEVIWPLFPATALLAVGFLVLAIEGNYLGETSLRSINMIFPIGLILVGITFFLKNLRTGSTR